jgi:hypothetical protein
VLKLEKELELLKEKFRAREKELLTKITCLQKRYQMQEIKYVNQCRDYESLVPSGNNNTCNIQVICCCCCCCSL